MGHLPQLRILEAFRVSVDTAAGAAQSAIMSRLRPFGLFIFPDEVLSRYQRIHHIPRQDLIIASLSVTVKARVDTSL